ncbi:uncharacterized protein LOC143259674 [Megalopta genalis]|uniref:uncharacterized protein LOC143259674 n=1 Tax=Megalopta genalis TaxID=115081 RepID=UPI003FD5B6F6
MAPPVNNQRLVDKLNIVSVNVSSIITNERRATLTDFLTLHAPDITLLCETKLSPSHKLFFKDYNLIRTDRPNSKQGGGTAILIRNSFKYKTRNIRTDNANPCLEFTIIEISLPDNHKLLLIAGYATSNCKKEFMQDLKCLFQKLKLEQTKNLYLLAGDLNAKHTAWGNTLNNSRGTSLHLWNIENQITYRTSLYSTESPSYPKSNSYIDLCLADNRIKFHNTESGKIKCIEYDSDHKALQMTISVDTMPLLLLDIDVPIKKNNYNKADWPLFEKHLEDKHEEFTIPNDRNLSTNEIDDYLIQINEHIIEAINNTVPKYNHNQNSTDKYITPNIDRLRKDKSYLITQINNIKRNNTLSYHDQITVKALNKLLKKVRHKIELAFYQSVSNHWKQKISNVAKIEPKKRFPEIKSIFRQKAYDTIDTLKILQNLSPLLHDAEIDSDTLEKDSDNNFIIHDTTDKLNILDLEKAFDTVWLEGLFFKLLKKQLPIHLIKMLWDMLHGKRFFTTEGNQKSTKKFSINNGLQQGTVNSPILFNIYMSDMLKMFGLNNTDATNDKSAIAFADDLLIYINHSKPSQIQIDLQALYEKIENYFQTWKLKINPQKCEAILFRPYISKISDANNDVRKHGRKFSIHTTDRPDEQILHKDTVRYLGVFLDFKLNYCDHIQIQIKKASKAFMSHKKLFYSKYLHKSVKILCYKTLVRPILTYGCQIWFNISASTMEKLRLFERKCIRACLDKYRSPQSNYTKLIANHTLYEEAKIIRIDLFIKKLIRDHWRKVNTVTTNSLISHSLYPNPLYFHKTLQTGYIPPEAFIYLDGSGLIQNKNKLPVIYHYNRKTFEKTIPYNSDLQNDDKNLRFMYKLSAIDLKKENIPKKKIH